MVHVKLIYSKGCKAYRTQSCAAKVQWQATPQSWAYDQVAKDDTADARLHVSHVCTFFETAINELDYDMIVMEFAKGVSVTNIEFNIRSPSTMSQGGRARTVYLRTGSLRLYNFCTL